MKTTTTDSGMTQWGNSNYADGQLYRWQTGPLNLWIRRDHSDWLIAEDKQAGDKNITTFETATNEPDGLKWMRWNFSKPTKHLKISPVMPDRPLVVKTFIPSNLLPRAKVTIYLSIPVWVRLAAVEGIEESEITRISSTIISNTWFGDNFDGELCYAIKTRAVRDIKDMKVFPHRAICPFTIHNKADTPLPIEKICLRAKYLNVYQSTERLWTSKVMVSFHGDGYMSPLNYSAETIKEAGTCTLLHKGERAPDHNFLKTFAKNFFDSTN